MMNDAIVPNWVNTKISGVSKKDLMDLAKDRTLITPELHKVNDFYGHASVLKKALCIEPEYPLKVMLEHGPTLAQYIWKLELDTPFHYFLCANEYYANAFNASAKGQKLAVPIGPYPAYLLPTKNLPLPTQKTLVVFPQHSTHHYWLSESNSEHLLTIAKLGKNFDRVLVCMYWKDILLNRHEPYYALGFECTTAGHMFDPKFLYRLISIISSGTMVISGYPGTDVVYSGWFGKPVFLFAEDLSYASSNKHYAAMRKNLDKHDNDPNSLIQKLKKTFSEKYYALTDEQNKLVAYCAGSNHTRTKKELLDILTAAEFQFCKRTGSAFHGIPTY